MLFMSKKSITDQPKNMFRPVIYLILPLFFTFAGADVTAQKIDIDKVTEGSVEWSEGTIFLQNGEQLKGLVKLNTKTGLLAFESGSNSRSFTPRSVAAFEFFDAAQVKKRSFISVEYQIPDPPAVDPFASKKSKPISAKVPQFFEIQLEFPTFALVSTIGQLGLEQKAGSPGGFSSGGVGVSVSSDVITYSQTETLLILDSEGNLNPVLEITNTETDRALFDSNKTKSKSLDDELIEKYTSPHYKELVKYAKEMKLSFKRKEELLKIMEYYKSLVAD
jgi:hypothetical protein